MSNLVVGCMHNHVTTSPPSFCRTQKSNPKNFHKREVVEPIFIFFYFFYLLLTIEGREREREVFVSTHLLSSTTTKHNLHNKFVHLAI